MFKLFGTAERLKVELTREHYRSLVYYDFKVGLTQEESLQRLKTAFDNEASYRATVFRGLQNFAGIVIPYTKKNIRVKNKISLAQQLFQKIFGLYGK
ncbi:hypothetical protein Zmor_014531 [Zophobas morio]|uniref:Uncharacterized protein n=1 Tax=Zophobas morio TaxID=2755281 RepID=A0AA38IHX4_9CUCU|nr:hypothetical protein Zmor_014531 [Zophobas morio]